MNIVDFAACLFVAILVSVALSQHMHSLREDAQEQDDEQ